MTQPSKDRAASIRQRLLNISQRERLDFQLVLTRYGIERLLYRLSHSPYHDRFLLKGAMLFVAWEGWSPRPTRDVDLLGRGDSSSEALRAIFEAVCQTEVEPDGLVFAADSLSVTDIREEQAYGGQRVRLRATLGEARINLQVDVGFGDVVTPPPALITFPALLDLPAPQILAYPRETVVAEKFEALIRLGLVNSRMKDFFDLDLLARSFAFDGELLARAVRATFQRRQTPLPAQPPPALSAEFSHDPTTRAMWTAFRRKTYREAEAGEDLEAVLNRLSAFLLPVSQAAERGEAFRASWQPGGPWQITGA